MDSTQSGSSDSLTFDFVATKNGFALSRVCKDRYTPKAGAKDITQNFYSYFPLDKFNTETFASYDFAGIKTGDTSIRSGVIYPSYDGKRLVLEVGCTTVIYLQISPGNPLKNHHFFIESHKDFLTDTITRALAAKVSHAAQPMVTVGKDEMYFMLGIFSTVSFSAWLAITGVSVTFSSMKQHYKMQEFEKLAKVILHELANIKKYAPMLYKKLVQLIIAERDKLALHTAEKLPSTIAHDKMARAKIAGILYGKYFLSPKMLTVWGAFLTVLIQVGIKSVTDSPKAAIRAIDDRYNPIIHGFANTNWANIQERKAAVMRLVHILKEDKISITAHDLEQIVKEVIAHPRALEKSLIHIVDAIKTFHQHVR